MEPLLASEDNLLLAWNGLFYLWAVLYKPHGPQDKSLERSTTHKNRKLSMAPCETTTLQRLAEG